MRKVSYINNVNVSWILGCLCFFCSCTVSKNGLSQQKNSWQERSRVDTLRETIYVVDIQNVFLQECLDSFIARMTQVNDYDKRTIPLLLMSVQCEKGNSFIEIISTNNFGILDSSEMHGDVFSRVLGGFTYKGFQIVVWSDYGGDDDCGSFKHEKFYRKMEMPFVVDVLQFYSKKTGDKLLYPIWDYSEKYQVMGNTLELKSKNYIPAQIGSVPNVACSKITSVIVWFSIIQTAFNSLKAGGNTSCFLFLQPKRRLLLPFVVLRVR